MAPNETRHYRRRVDRQPFGGVADDPTSGDWSKDAAALRLRDLTDYVYQMIVSSPRP